jgi:prolyl-tRNA editing enzyme YbaK/EbsC (Cys-tRNA(Pro) deacylase)
VSIERVREYLKHFGKDKDIQEFNVSSATVELAARALGVIPARIAKSIAMKVDDGCVLVVSAGDVKINSSKFKAYFAAKAKMMNAAETYAFTGHKVGGVCPFAIENPEVKVFLDVSLQRFASVYPACGSSSSGIEMTCDELFACAKALDWVDVCNESVGWLE